MHRTGRPVAQASGFLLSRIVDETKPDIHVEVTAHTLRTFPGHPIGRAPDAASAAIEAGPVTEPATELDRRVERDNYEYLFHGLSRLSLLVE